MGNVVINRAAIERVGQAAVRAKMLPVETDLNNLLPGCAGRPVDSLIHTVRRICEGRGISFSGEQLSKITGALADGRRVNL